MTELTTPETIVTLLAASRTQIDVITTLSSGGLGVIILSWGRILGIIDDADFSAFKKPALLIIPAICLLLAVIIGYFAGAQTTGYYTEIASGVDSSTCKTINGEIECQKISNATDYYFGSYDTSFHWMMFTQLITSILGIVLLAGWFAWNILSMKRKSQ
jgi:hypothetical protein